MSVAQSRLDTMATTTSTRSDALDVLRTLVGRDDARFHDGQFEAIDALVADHRRALVVQRTGWGCRERREMTLDVMASGGFECVRGFFVVTLS